MLNADVLEHHHRWILFIGGWVLIGGGNLLRETGTMMWEKTRYSSANTDTSLPLSKRQFETWWLLAYIHWAYLR